MTPGETNADGTVFFLNALACIDFEMLQGSLATLPTELSTVRSVSLIYVSFSSISAS